MPQKMNVQYCIVYMSMGAFQDPGKSLENPDFQRRTQGREIIRIRVLSGLPLPGPRKGEVMEYTVEERVRE